MRRWIFPLTAAVIIACLWAIPGNAAMNTGAASAEAGGIPPGTVITPQNWQKYKQFMTDGLQMLFADKFRWQFPADYQMVVGPTGDYQLPATFLEQTKKYSGQVKIVNLPDGRHNITGYVGGIPFPNPEAPLKGWKLLIDDWYDYAPYLLCADTCAFTFEDRFNNITGNKFFFVQRLFDHRGDKGVSVKDPTMPGIFYTELIEVEEPEQARYTAVLTVYYSEMAKSEDTYIFVPALRRSLRLSTAARCSPAVGSDYTNDDTRHGAFNGNPTRFDAKFLGDRSVLEQAKINSQLSPDNNQFYLPLFFPKPSIGKWEARPSWMIDVRRVPSERSGYCYGKRILYVDKQVYESHWADLYDQNMKLWKIDYDPQGLISVPGEGEHWTNDGWGVMFDVQNMHISRVSLSGDGGAVRANSDCKNLGGRDFTDAVRYSSVRGLAEIMR
ncbi:MAG: DUF1329 domain-containing protein [Candidatus Binataceae bacterium]